MEHPPYSPNLAPKVLCLFSKIKSALKGRMFQNTEYIQRKGKTLNTIPQKCFQKCFQQWKHRSAKCIAAQVNYLEGDPSQCAESIQVCLQ